MRLDLDPGAFRDMLSEPALTETLSAVAGYPMIVVWVADASAGRLLAGLDLAALPAVVVVVVPDPASLPAGAFAAADVILTEDVSSAAPFTAPRPGVTAALAQIGSSLTEHPVAGTALALLMRSSARLPVPAGLIAESATYSALQDGAEFLRWRAAHNSRQPEAGNRRLHVEQSAGELRITLARPARRNAVDWRMRDALSGALSAVVTDPGVRVVLRGDGPDFCAGGDLDEFGSRPDPALAHLIRLTRSPALLMHRLGARTTAYLHGSCMGAGIELPAFAARLHAAVDTRIGLPEIALGLIPGAGGTVSLPRRIGRCRTAFLALSGETVDAEQALQWGLIDTIGSEPS
jgi:hypothetical protein